jgi:FecR protein
MSPRRVIRTASPLDPTTGKRWSGRRFPSILLAAVALFGSGEVAWSAERIGGAEIVINIVEGGLPSGTIAPVGQGDAVYRDEGVRTRVDSKARLLLLDKTNLTVGPSSTIRLDRFVYSGPKQSGTIVLNLAKGTCRLVMGDANKHSYTIVTPTAAIGIRE